MKAVILVGGFGTRLRPLTFTTPKNLLPVVHVPMVERVVSHLAEHGVTDAVQCCDRVAGTMVAAALTLRSCSSASLRSESVTRSSLLSRMTSARHSGRRTKAW